MQISALYKIYSNNPIICTDTRKIKENSVFFALKGEYFNGNKFAQEAINKGCLFAVIDEKKYATNNQFILVEDVLSTMQKLAKYHRKKLNIPIIGITGTNGKTTSKELIYTALKSELNCYATKGNLNNHIGVALSILEINQKHDIAIIEMGANHKKEIKFLCEIANPTHGVITNIGSAHLQGFKSLQGVIDTKNELYTFIKYTNGIIFINNDDNLLIQLSKDIKAIPYGINSKLNISIQNNTKFLDIKWEKTSIRSKLIGDYQFYNISLAICIADYFKISKSNICAAISSYIPKNNRSEITKTKNNLIIMDAYNANPSSMEAMLISFSKKDYKNKLCILGDMLELGKYSNQEHTKILKLTQKLKIECLFVGEEFNKIYEKSFKNITELKEFYQNDKIKNKTILLKGSRKIGLEKLLQHL